MIKVIPEQFWGPFSKTYQICASGPMLKRGNRHIFCEGMLKRPPAVCLPDGSQDRLQYMHKMENVPHSFQIMCTLPWFFPCLTPLSPRQFSWSLVLTFARITYHCWMLSRKRRRNPPLTCLISPAGQLILLAPSFLSPHSLRKEKKNQQNKTKQKNWMWRELSLRECRKWCHSVIWVCAFLSLVYFTLSGLR